MTEEVVYPFQPHDWVMNDSGDVAKVKSVEHFDGEICLNLIMYDGKGNRLGRVSPALGGPRTFEPMCPIEEWTRIKEPVFPIQLHWETDADGKRTLRHKKVVLPPANYTKPNRPLRSPSPNDKMRTALEQIANGHNDARGLAKETLESLKQK